MKHITPGELNDFVEFDSPFQVHGAEWMVSKGLGIWSPSVYWNNEIDDYEVEPEEWEPVSGYSGQCSYSGPIMHPSEYFGGGMAEDILESPGIYVITEVIDLDDGDNLIGWMLLRLKD